MKKSIAFIGAVLMLGTLFSQTKRLDENNAYYVYLKGTKTKLSADEELNYAKVFENETYNKYKNDEFEWDDQFTTIKQNLQKKIEDADFSAIYTVVTEVEFGDYNFTDEGFPVEIGEGTFFPFKRPYYWYAAEDSIFEISIALKLDSLNKYNFFTLPKADAKAFLQSRKSSSGYVNRDITVEITYKIASFDSKEYKAFKDLALQNNYLPIVGIIEKIDIYDTSDSKNIKKIGELIKK